MTRNDFAGSRPAWELFDFVDDARLLVDHRRFASAFALGVLGVEEIGKALIEAWNRFHVLCGLLAEICHSELTCTSALDR